MAILPMCINVSKITLSLKDDAKVRNKSETTKHLPHF